MLCTRGGTRSALDASGRGQRATLIRRRTQKETRPLHTRYIQPTHRAPQQSHVTAPGLVALAAPPPAIRGALVEPPLGRPLGVELAHRQRKLVIEMSLYYSLVFGVLVFEVFIFSILALPIPTRFRKPLTLVLLKPFQNDVVQISIKCILGFILLLFVDTINKVYNIDSELQAASSANTKGGGVYSQDRIEVLSRKFFAQRNMYLTGMTLFLTFTVVRTFGLVQELLQLKDKYRKESPKFDTAQDEAANAKRRQELEREIKEKDTEIARLKEKAEALQKEM